MILIQQQKSSQLPKAIFLTALITPIILILANLSVNVILQNTEINNRSGLMDTFIIIFNATSTSFLQPLIAFMIFLGCFGCLSAWMLTLSIYLQKISKMGYIPKIFSFENKNGVPFFALVFQGLLFSILCLIYNLSTYIQTVYWFLCDLTAQVSLIAISLCLMSAIKLRLYYSWDDAYTVTKFKSVSVLIYFLGMLSCVFGIIMGFLTPTSDYISSTKFNLLLIVGIIFTFLIPILIKKFHK